MSQTAQIINQATSLANQLSTGAMVGGQGGAALAKLIALLAREVESLQKEVNQLKGS
jgi:hypothetical protein